MKYPRFLKKWDTIGVSALSYDENRPPDNMEKFIKGSDSLRGMGYHVVCTPDTFPEREYTHRERADEFNLLLRDDDVRCIFAARGGDHQHEMLDMLDWSALEKDPKWIQGYSDNTSALVEATVDHDIATIYCNNFGDFGMKKWHRSVKENLEFIQGKRMSQSSFDYYEDGFKEEEAESYYEDSPVEWINEGRFEGRLIGGCMDILEWFESHGIVDVPSFTSRYGNNGIVWYMETFDMTEQRIRKMFSRMGSNGWLDNVSGFVFGRELFYSGDNYNEVITDCLREYGVPLVFGADVGHKAPRMTFINGAIAEFDVKDGGCTINYRFD